MKPTMDQMLTSTAAITPQGVAVNRSLSDYRRALSRDAASALDPGSVTGETSLG